jgi:hypothetical protein
MPCATVHTRAAGLLVRMGSHVPQWQAMVCWSCSAGHCRAPCSGCSTCHRHVVLLVLVWFWMSLGQLKCQRSPQVQWSGTAATRWVAACFGLVCRFGSDRGPFSALELRVLAACPSVGRAKKPRNTTTNSRTACQCQDSDRGFNQQCVVALSVESLEAHAFTILQGRGLDRYPSVAVMITSPPIVTVEGLGQAEPLARRPVESSGSAASKPAAEGTAACTSKVTDPDTSDVGLTQVHYQMTPYLWSPIDA